MGCTEWGCANHTCFVEIDKLNNSEEYLDGHKEQVENLEEKLTVCDFRASKILEESI